MSIFAVLIALAVQGAAPKPSDAPQFRGEGQMRIFDMLCNQVFPDDARIATAMAGFSGARPLTPAELRTYLKNDPGRGWVIPAGTSQLIVTLESPPVHACAIRMTNTDGVIDEQVWQRLIAAAQARAGGGFTNVPPRTLDLGNVQTRVSGVQKQSTGGAAEAFYLIRTAPKASDAQRPADTEIRMVRQLVTASGQ